MISPCGFDFSQLADWAELTLALGRDDYLSKSDISRCLPMDDAKNEDLVESVWAELERRGRLYSPRRFKIGSDGFSIESTPEGDDAAYRALLLLSMYGLQKGFPKSITDSLEQIVDHALRLTMGNSMHMGWTRTMKGTLQERVEGLSERLYLSRGEDVPSSANDDRVDVVAWHDFGDGRSCGHVILTQVTCQKTWKDKRRPSVESWGRYIKGLRGVLPAFAIPQLETSLPDKFARAQADVEALILDRPRILNAISREPLEAVLLSEIDAWNTEALLCVEETD